MKSGMNKRILFLLLECIAITISLMLTSAAMTEGHDGHYNYTVSNGEIRICSVAPNISGELVVPESIAGYPVTTIGTFAFNRLTNVTSIHLPSSLTTIENYAFMGCSSLESITIPDHVKTLGEATFQNCTALKSFTLSDSITEIPLGTFSGCTSLESIIIPENIQAIGIGAFAGTLTNTVLVITALNVFNGFETLTLGVTTTLNTIITTLIGVNGIIEVVAAVILVPAIYMATEKYLKNKI